VPAGHAAAVAAALTAGGAVEADPATLEALRIEAAYPTPADIPAKTLPQELGRDARAISFTKGCYLGQETVARLDALGHVNRRLVALALEAPVVPPLPAAVMRAGAEVGAITSACRSPRTGGLLGLGLVQVKALAGGGLEVAGSPARPLAGEGQR
jgi:tRNA-modifying protein YgfZ